VPDPRLSTQPSFCPAGRVDVMSVRPALFLRQGAVAVQACNAVDNGALVTDAACSG